MGALYRPGPLSAGLTDSFIKRKNGLQKVTYDHPAMKPALESTFGVLVYQEQFMQISRDVCGFSGGEADTLRKAIGKKKRDVMAKMETRFIEGAIEHSGISRAMIEDFWKKLLGFADYCFNKSHSACYGMISYWTAYLKAHFPDAFMAALMTSDSDDTDRLSIEISECLHQGINVLAPDVNESFSEFAVVPGQKAIRFGMAAIKGVGVGAVEAILSAREDGVFTSVEDFARRVPASKVNRRVWESLIKSGAFDSFHDRSDLLYNLDNITGLASKLQKETLSGQTNLFGELDAVNNDSLLRIVAAPQKHTDKEKLTWERELLGLYLSAHPLDHYTTFLHEQTLTINQLTHNNDAVRVTVGGIISTIRTVMTKSGGKMAFIGMEDAHGEYEAIVFPRQFESVVKTLIQDAVVKINGTVQARGRDGNFQDDIKIIVESIEPITDNILKDYESTGEKASLESVSTIRKRYNKKTPQPIETSSSDRPKISSTPSKSVLYIHIKDTSDHDTLRAAKAIMSKHPGIAEAVMVLGEDKSSAMRLPFRIDITHELENQLSQLFGKECIVTK
jgi:DNA polymerase-3 subunit alpha